jgi:serine/threonine-protein kinase
MPRPGGRVVPPERLIRAQSEPGITRFSFTALPPELLEQSRVQLTWVAGAAAIATLAIAWMARLMQPEVAEAQKQPIFQWTVAAVVVSSLIIISLELYRRIPAGTVVLAGLYYEVVIAASIGVFENTIPWEAGSFVRGASSITLWLTAFALLVPAPPVTAFVFGLIAAATGPVSHYLVTNALGLPFAEWNRLAIYYSPPFLLALASGLINFRVLKLEWAAVRAKELGSYELRSKLAEGGMGEVWRASHRLLKRDAAIKLIRPEILWTHTGSHTQKLLQRFEQEARTIASLKSPHTVALYDYGMTDEGSLYYAMELLEGLDLDQLVRRFGPQPASRIAYVLAQACDSLEEAHRRGLVHRDIKPTNLYLCRMGVRYDYCKLLDFGLVKRAIPDNRTMLTMDGIMTGTPAFIAPEVALGSKTVTGSADVYGLGCVAYWLLTGRLVFEAENPTAMALAHVQKQPAPPSEVAEIAAPREFEELVLRCLAKEPEARPASAAELASEMGRMEYVAPWGAVHAEKWWRTNLPALVEVGDRIKPS